MVCTVAGYIHVHLYEYEYLHVRVFKCTNTLFSCDLTCIFPVTLRERKKVRCLQSEGGEPRPISRSEMDTSCSLGVLT